MTLLTLESDWSAWANFGPAEFICKCGCGEMKVDSRLLDLLQGIRTRVGFAMPVNSGYRCAKHPAEAKKKNGPGAHNAGLAADIFCNGRTAHPIMAAAFEFNVQGVGVSMRPGHSHFLHLDLWNHAVRPNVWSY